MLDASRVGQVSHKPTHERSVAKVPYQVRCLVDIPTETGPERTRVRGVASSVLTAAREAVRLNAPVRIEWSPTSVIVLFTLVAYRQHHHF